MKIACNRPNFCPWLGFMALLDKVDSFIVLDNIVISSRNFGVRNRIKDIDGKERWISESQKTNSRVFVKDAVLHNPGKETIVNQLNHFYRKAPFFASYSDKINQAIWSKETNLVEYNINILKTLCSILGISVKFLKCSGLVKKEYKDPEERIIDACIAAGGKEYYNGRDGIEKGLYHAEKFKAKNMKLFKQIYEHPVYPQINGPFLPFMSVIDLIYNCGPESLKMIRSGCKWELQ